MQKLKDNWVLILAILVSVTVIVVVAIKHTKLSPVMAGSSDLKANIDFKS